MASAETHWSIPAGVAAAAGFLTGCLIPFGTYIGNSKDFPGISSTTMLLISLLAFVLVTLFFFGLLFLLQRVSRKLALWAMVMVSALTIAVYGQGNVFGARYQILDGKSIPWEKMTGTGILNTALWLLIIGAGIFTAAKYKEKALVVLRNVMLCFAGFMALVTFMRFLTVPTVPLTTAAYNNKDFYSVSSRRNIFVFILDGFDIQLFDQLQKEFPGTAGELTDFVNYSNTIGKFPTTQGALPHILTGVPNDNTKKYADYLDSAFSNSVFISEARKKEFDLYFYTYQTFTPRYKILKTLPHIKNTEEVKFSFFKDDLGSYSSAYRCSFFTYLPHFLKRYTPLWPSTNLSKDNWTFSDNVTRWLAELPHSRQLSAATDRNVCKIFHLAGVHFPDYNVPEARKNIELIKNFIGELKRLGVYEKSSIIITADHGSIDTARPIFICNTGKGTLQNSEEPFSFDSLSPYLTSLLKDKSAQPPIAKGVRQFWSYILAQRVSQLYLPPLKKIDFNLDGSRLISKEQRKSVYNGEDLSALTAYNFSLEVPRSNGRWAGKGKSSITLPLLPEYQNKDIFLEATVILPLGSANPFQELTVSVNKAEPVIFKFDRNVAWKPQILTLKVPREFNTKEALFLEIEGKHAITWKEVLDNKEYKRQLTFLLEKCEVKFQASVPNIPQKISFFRGQELANLPAQALSDETTGRWTYAKRSALTIPLDKELADSDLRVTFDTNTLLTAKFPVQQFSCYLGNKKLAAVKYKFPKTGKLLKVKIPKELHGGKDLQFVFETEYLRSPSEMLPGNPDTRKLGVSVISCKISKK